ncbi:MAG: type IV pilus assembly PilZ, partial [Anaerolineales bacterium]|nr:type IV pilus assembly PilZ [Anaerolineales bacterium]
SSGGVLFSSDQVLSVGTKVELAIDWPFLLQRTCALRLVVMGRVLRSDPSGTAIQTERYEFRVRALHPRDNSPKQIFAA